METFMSRELRDTDGKVWPLGESAILLDWNNEASVEVEDIHNWESR